MLDVSCFELNPKSQTPYSKCSKCRPKHSKNRNVSRNARKVQKRRHDELEYADCASCGVRPISEFSVSKRSPRPKAHCDRCCIRLHDRWEEKNGSESSKQARKRYECSTKGQETKKKSSAARNKLIRSDQLLALDKSIQQAASFLLSGRSTCSPTFLKHANFTSEEEFRCAVQDTFDRESMNWTNYGTYWELDHKIPREAFDFGNPEDVRRCWSRRNITAKVSSDNKKKSWKLIDHWIEDAGVGCFPTAWDGLPPTEEMKKAHAAKCMQGTSSSE